MSLLLLDATFLIEAERRGVDLDDAIEHDDDVAVAAITVAELLVGARLGSGRRRAARQAYVDDAMVSLPIIAYDTDVAIEHAELLIATREAGRPRGAHDLVIAATARATGRTIVTTDQRAFADLPGVTAISHR
jgi:tRNA(fMet)-specific endonuclease VapC